MHVLNGGQGQHREDASAPSQGEDQGKSPPGGIGMLPEAQYPSGSAERKETEAGNNFGSARKIGAPFMLAEPIGDQTIPSRGSEMRTCEIRGCATHDEPGAPLWKHQRQQHDGNPRQSLPDSTGRDKGFAVGTPLQNLHRNDLSHRSNELRQCRQQAQLERACLKEQRESGKILLPASLRDSLTGTVPEAVAKTLLTTTARPGVAWHGFLRVF